MGLLKTKVANPDYTAQNPFAYTGNTTMPNIEPIEERFHMLIPMAVVVTIILALLVYITARNRRRLVHFYFKKQQGGHCLREDNEYDSPLEDCDVEQEHEIDNEESPTKSLLRGKLQINNRHENYLSTSQLIRSSEMFT